MTDFTAVNPEYMDQGTNSDTKIQDDIDDEFLNSIIDLNQSQDGFLMHPEQYYGHSFEQQQNNNNQSLSQQLLCNVPQNYGGALNQSREFNFTSVPNSPQIVVQKEETPQHQNYLNFNQGVPNQNNVNYNQGFTNQNKYSQQKYSPYQDEHPMPYQENGGPRYGMDATGQNYYEQEQFHGETENNYPISSAVNNRLSQSFPQESIPFINRAVAQYQAANKANQVNYQMEDQGQTYYMNKQTKFPQEAEVPSFALPMSNQLPMLERHSPRYIDDGFGNQFINNQARFPQQQQQQEKFIYHTAQQPSYIHEEISSEDYDEMNHYSSDNVKDVMSVAPVSPAAAYHQKLSPTYGMQLSSPRGSSPRGASPRGASPARASPSPRGASPHYIPEIPSVDVGVVPRIVEPEEEPTYHELYPKGPRGHSHPSFPTQQRTYVIPVDSQNFNLKVEPNTAYSKAAGTSAPPSTLSSPRNPTAVTPTFPSADFKLPASKSPIIDSLCVCALNKWGIEVAQHKRPTHESLAYVEFLVTDFEKYYRASRQICSKLHPTEDISARVKSLRRWFVHFPKKKERRENSFFRLSVKPSLANKVSEVLERNEKLLNVRKRRRTQ